MPPSLRALLPVLCLLAFPAGADDAPARPQARPAAEVAPAPAATPTPGRGPETNLPLPRYVSMRAEEGNARRGPSTTHRIDWVFQRRHTPLRVTAEYEHWRRVEDRDGQGGWMHYALLSGVRYALLEQRTTVLARPDPKAGATAIFEAGVIARILECQPDWCRLRADGHRGWAPKTALWGVEPKEVFD